MKSPDQHHHIEQRDPSTSQCLAMTTAQGGCVFKEPSELILQHFICAGDVEQFFATPEGPYASKTDGWVAHMLLKHVAGDPRQLNGQQP